MDVDYSMFSRACKSLSTETAWEIVTYLDEHGDCTLGEIQIGLDIDITDLHDTIAELMNGGIVVNLVTTKGSVYRVSQLGEKLIDAILKVFEKYYSGR